MQTQASGVTTPAPAPPFAGAGLSGWSTPPNRLRLEPGAVHVWRCSLDVTDEEFSALRSHLAPDEIARSERFRFECDRRSFIAARGFLRGLLGRYLGQPPLSVAIRYGSHGKPELKGRELAFNLSHSGNLALCAFTAGVAVGIDVERHRPGLAQLQIAEHFFSRAEVRGLRSLPEEERPAGFFNCWTRKEAFIKALGEGLSHPLDSFEVTLRPGEPAALGAARLGPDEVSRWSLHALDLGPGWSAALAVAAQSPAIHRFQAPPPPPPSVDGARPQG